MDEFGPAMEEYRNLRQESLAGLTRQQTIAQYGLAAVGVALGIGLVAEEHERTGAAVIVLMALVPLLAVFGALMLATEAQRVTRAGWYLRSLESRINGCLPPDAEPLGWETLLAAEPNLRVRGYGVLTIIVVAVTAVISIGIGGYLLQREQHWAWLVVGVVADAVLLTAFGWWARRCWRRLNWFASAELDARPIR